MNNKSNKTSGTSKTTNKNVNNVSYSKNGKNGKGGTAVKKDRTWLIYVTIGVVALVGIVLLAVFGGGSTNKANGQQGSPSQQQQTLPDCCQ